MPSLKCTKKLADRAGLKLSKATCSTDHDWHANLFVMDRRSYVIFCEDRSRLSVLSGPVRKPDLQDLPELLREGLFKVLRFERFSADSIEYEVSKLDDMRVYKSDNRSVLGTISDNMWHVDVHSYHDGGIANSDMVDLARRLNHMPMSPLGYQYAIEVFRRSAIRVA